jgi:hypothetical protein
VLNAGVTGNVGVKKMVIVMKVNVFAGQIHLHLKQHLHHLQNVRVWIVGAWIMKCVGKMPTVD